MGILEFPATLGGKNNTTEKKRNNQYESLRVYFSSCQINFFLRPIGNIRIFQGVVNKINYWTDVAHKKIISQ